MNSRRRNSADRIRRAFSWEGLAAVVVLVVTVCAWRYGDRLEFWQQVMLGVLGVLALASVLRRGLAVLCGPVFLYDLVRNARGGRQVWMRCFYAVILLGVLFLMYSSWFLSYRGGLAAVFYRSTLPLWVMASFASTFFYLFMLVQFGLVVVLTPVYVAGAITQEKERGSLDLLLTTGLSNREIVVGMLSARLANMLLLLLTGLPILSLMELLGGVDPNLVVLGFAFTGVTLLSVGSLSILISVCNSSLNDALFRTYLWMAIFLVCGIFIPGLSSGHPLLVVIRLGYPQYQPSVFFIHWLRDPKSWPGVGLTGGEVVALLSEYAWFHLWIILGCTGVAIALLRMTVRKPEQVAAPKPKRAKVTKRRLNQDQAPIRSASVLGDEAMWWKEVTFASPRRRSLNRGFLIASTGVIGGLVVLGVKLLLSDSNRISMDVNQLEVTLGTLLAGVMLLIVTSIAATSVNREWEQQTLESLLTTPVEREAILYAKWLASIYSIRNLGWCLAAMWLVGVLTGGLHYLAVPLLLIALLVYLAFAASLGLYFSTLYRTGVRAVLWSLLAMLTMSFGPWLVGYFGRQLFRSVLSRRAITWMVWFLRDGLSPPAGLVTLTVPLDVSMTRHDQSILVVMSGLLYYAVAAWLLWLMAKARFAALRGPAPIRPPRESRLIEPPAPLDQGLVLEALASGPTPSLNAGPIDSSHPDDDPPGLA